MRIIKLIAHKVNFFIIKNLQNTVWFKWNIYNLYKKNSFYNIILLGVKNMDNIFIQYSVEEFDKLYQYDGTLGAIYSKEKQFLKFGLL